MKIFFCLLRKNFYSVLWSSSAKFNQSFQYSQRVQKRQKNQNTKRTQDNKITWIASMIGKHVFDVLVCDLCCSGYLWHQYGKTTSIWKSTIADKYLALWSSIQQSLNITKYICWTEIYLMLAWHSLAPPRDFPTSLPIVPLLAFSVTFVSDGIFIFHRDF